MTINYVDFMRDCLEQLTALHDLVKRTSPQQAREEVRQHVIYWKVQVGETLAWENPPDLIREWYAVLLVALDTVLDMVRPPTRVRSDEWETWDAVPEAPPVPDPSEVKVTPPLWENKIDWGEDGYSSGEERNTYPNETRRAAAVRPCDGDTMDGDCKDCDPGWHEDEYPVWAQSECEAWCVSSQHKCRRQATRTLHGINYCDQHYRAADAESQADVTFAASSLAAPSGPSEAKVMVDVHMLNHETLNNTHRTIDLALWPDSLAALKQEGYTVMPQPKLNNSQTLQYWAWPALSHLEAVKVFADNVDVDTLSPQKPVATQISAPNHPGRVALRDYLHLHQDDLTVLERGLTLRTGYPCRVELALANTQMNSIICYLPYHLELMTDAWEDVMQTSFDPMSTVKSLARVGTEAHLKILFMFNNHEAEVSSEWQDQLRALRQVYNTLLEGKRR